MAKKVDEELADPYERIISTEIPAGIASRDPATAPDSEWETVYGAWQAIPNSENSMFYETSIDLSGYANQSLTFFPESGFRQQAPYSAITGATAAGLIEATIITTVPMSAVDILNAIALGTTPALPQVFESDPTQPATLNDPGLMWSNVLYCDVRLGLVDIGTPSNTGFVKPTQAGQTGSLQATAADKLYVYKVLRPLNTVAPTDLSSIASGAERVGLIGVMAQEPTVEYMMRLKRSYELANQVKA